MGEGFAIDRERLYGFDYENTLKEAAAWASAWTQNNEAVVLEEAEVMEEVIVDEAAEQSVEKIEIVEETAEETEDAELSAKEAFFEFARGIPSRPPQAVPTPLPWPPMHRPPSGGHHIPRPPQPQPPRPGHGNDHNFNPNSGSAPRFAPPAYTPQRAPGLRAVDPGAISRCLYSNTYVWLNNRQEFWFFPTFVGRKSIAGYRWMHRHWVFMGFSLHMIDSFFCGGR